MYTEVNFQTKKELKNAVASGERISIYQPNDMFGIGIPKVGKFVVEGPHYPKPHKWYASVEIRDGIIVSVK